MFFYEGNYFIDKLINLVLICREQYKWFDVLSYVFI